MTELSAEDTTAATARRLLSARIAQARRDRGAARIPVRADRRAATPLTATQAGIWFAAQYEPDSPAYNVPLALHLTGRLDRPALRAAVHDLARRHEVLHSVVGIGADGNPVAVPTSPDAVPVAEVDLGGEPDPAAAMRARLAEAATRPFALAAQCPMRARIYRLDELTHVLGMTFHHIAVDAWSLRLLATDLAACYAARSGLAAAPPPPPLQFADVAAWPGAAPDPAGRAAVLAWWRSRLAGLPELLALPTDRPRPAVPETAGDQVPVELAAATAQRVRALAGQTGTTVFMVLLAAWQVLLARLAATDDLAVGVISAGRRHPDLEQVVGCFVDTLAIRGDLGGEPTGRELLARVRSAALDALGHADVSLPEVLDAVRPGRVAGAHPLFQVLLNVYDEPLRGVSMPGLRATWLEVDTGTAKFDLSLNLVDAGPGEGIRGWLAYRTALFDQSSVRSLVAWFGRLLDGLLANLDRPIAELPLAIVDSPVLAGPAREHAVGTPLHRLVERWVAGRGDAIAVIGADATLSWAELDRRANQVAHRLCQAGVGRDQPVAVWVERGTELAVGMLAVLKAGGAYLPVDPGYPPGRVRQMLAAAGCRVVLTQPALATGLARPANAGAGTLVLDIAEIVASPGPAAAQPPVHVRPDQLAYVIFTSGSTGTPKAVAVEHRSIVHYLHAVADRIGAAGAGGGSYALVSTAAADLGLTCLFGALVTGGTLHILDRETALDPAALGRYLATHHVDVLKLVPSHLRLLAAHGDLAAVLPRRLLIVAGEACDWDLVDRVRAARPDLAVQSHYGPTETTVAVLACDIDEIPPARRVGTLPLGRPMSNAVLHVVDPAGRPLPPGMPGELVIAGPGVARGYLGREDLTVQRFRPDPLTGVGRCYHTGDRVRLGLDGTLSFLGRVDDQVKIRGYRVEPGEVAAACRLLPGVADAFVLPVGEDAHRRLAAWLVPAGGAPALDVAALRERLHRELPEHLVPTAFTLVDQLPLGPNGKVDRAALPAPVEAARAALRTDTQRRIAGIWSRLLDVAEIGADDDFFALGGDSFAAVRAVRAIDSRLRVIDLFTHRTVATLATYLDGMGPDGTATSRPPGLLHRLAGPAPQQAALTAVGMPYGGGSAAALQPFASALSQARGDIAVYAVELPGHDPARPDEALMPLADLVDACAAEIAELPGPILVYGHCVGTAAALALARRLERDGRAVLGVVLAASFPTARLPGRLAGWVQRLMPSDRWLNDRTYRDILATMGGLEGVAAPETATLLRALRHDARQAQAWFSDTLTGDGRTPTAAGDGGGGGGSGGRLRAPVLSVVGERDRTTELYAERYREWGAFAERVELATIPRAGHYFLKHQASRLAEIVAGRLADWQAGHRPEPVADPGLSRRETRRSLRAFALVATGQFTSMVGSQLSAFAMGVWVYQETGRLLDFAVLTMLALVPAVLVAPLGGALTDRFDRRRVMLAADVSAALAVGGLVGQLLTGELALWHIFAVVTVASVATAIQRPAYFAATAELVPKPFLPQANALANLGTGVGTLLGPLAGGVLITAVGLPGVVALDLASFLVAIGTLVLVQFPGRLFRRRDEPFGRSLAGGWRFISHRRPMIVMIVFYLPVNYLLAVAIVLVTPLVLATSSAVTLGVVTAAGGLGAAVGALVMVGWGGTKRLAHGMVGATIPVGAGTVMLGAAPDPRVVAAGLFVFWASLAILNAHWMSILQIKVGPDLLGRVLAINQMLATAMMPLGFVTAPALAERVVAPLVGGALTSAMAAMLVATGLVLVGWGIGGLAWRSLRLMEDGLPDALAGAEIAADLDEVQRAVDEHLAAGVVRSRP